MILSRVIAHVKAQNWTAIAVDFFIVVFGVFIGIQLGNWNDARVERGQSVFFTHALEQDLRADAALYRAVADYYSSVRENGVRALSSLERREPLSDEDLVVSAYRASQVALAPINRSTFDELVSTGRINLIANKALRAAAIEHFGLDFIAAAHADGRQSEYRQLFRGDISPDAHQAARAQCGDRRVGEVTSLAYDCALGLPAPIVARAATALRADRALPAALRRRANELDVQIRDLRAQAARLERSVSPPEPAAP